MNAHGIHLSNSTSFDPFSIRQKHQQTNTRTHKDHYTQMYYSFISHKKKILSHLSLWIHRHLLLLAHIFQRIHSKLKKKGPTTNPMHIAYKCILLFSLPSLLSIQNVHARAVNDCCLCVCMCSRWLSSNILNFYFFFSLYSAMYTVCLTNKPRLWYNGCTKKRKTHTHKHMQTFSNYNTGCWP